MQRCVYYQLLRLEVLDREACVQSRDTVVVDESPCVRGVPSSNYCRFVLLIVPVSAQKESELFVAHPRDGHCRRTGHTLMKDWSGDR